MSNDRNSLGVDTAILERWRQEGLIKTRPIKLVPGPTLLVLLEQLAVLAAHRAAGTDGPWFYNSYAAIFAAPLIKLAEDWPTDGANVAEPARYYQKAEPLVASVPPLVGDLAHGRHAADAGFIAAAGSFDFAGLYHELLTLLSAGETAGQDPDQHEEALARRHALLESFRIHEGDPAARLPFFDVATLLSTYDPNLPDEGTQEFDVDDKESLP